MLFERVGGALAYLFFRVGASPNAVTLMGGVAGIAGATRLGPDFYQVSGAEVRAWV